MSKRAVAEFNEQMRGPAQLVLAAAVARRYYVDAWSKVEIAEEFGLSRFKVARILDAAREWGVVRIEIGYPGTIDVELSSRLQTAFHLAHALVVDTDDNHDETLREHLGRAAAELLAEIVEPTDVLGLAWARSVSAMATQLRQLPQIPVVQLTGALFQAAGEHPTASESSIDVVRQVAQVTGGPAYVFFAPFLVADATTARALRSQPDVAQAVEKMSLVTKAVVGIGRWAKGDSMLYEAATEAERRRLARQGICADASGVFLKADGTPIQTSLNNRMVGMNAAQLGAIPEVIGIAYGVSKAPAVRAALTGGLVNGLVTHASLATALLAEQSQG